MGVFFDIICSFAWNILWGVLIAAVCIALFLVALKGWFKNAKLSPWTYVVGTVLFVFLVIQLSLLIGAVDVMCTVDDIELAIKHIVETAGATNLSVESQQVFDTIKEKYPMLDLYMGWCDHSSANVTPIAMIIGDSVRDYLTSYIWHRIWWILGAMALACGLVILTSRNVSKSANFSYDNSSEISISDTNEWGI